jgi:hypothetical protein
MTRAALAMLLLLPVRLAAADPWLRLFDGESLFGWTSEGEVRAQVNNGVLTLSPAAGGWLRYNAPFADFDLRLEYQFDQSIDSGLLLRAPGSASPGGYQIELGDLSGDGYGAGSIAGVTRARKTRLLPGVWHTLEVSVRGSSVTVRLNGREVAAARSFQAPAGFPGIEAPAGGALRLRRLDLLPVGLAPLFNGMDLTGWRGMDPPGPAASPAEWTVRDGSLHVEKGPGQLETESAWDDFVLRLEARVNTIDPARHPDSGVFFRGDRDAWWSGYESQIRNEFTSGDRSRPVEFGTGGIYGRQPARRVAANDNEWFTKTIVASGRRICVWVDGLLVTDYLDEGEAGAGEGKARLMRGTIGLQSQDAATNVDFREIRIAPLPRLTDRPGPP